MHPVVITGIDTGIGKTLAAAILTEALEADYWKPVQAGSLDDSDTQFVASMVRNKKSTLHPEAYRLNHFMSPHAAAEKDDFTIDTGRIEVPETDNILLIEGAGGLMVPLTRQFHVLDLMEQWQYPVILVSKNYLGSINHTLLSVEVLQQRKIPILGILFNGEETPTTESVILEYTGVERLGRIPTLPKVDPETIQQQAQSFKKLRHVIEEKY